MTRDEYNASVEHLLGNIDRLHFDNRELVVVMSRDVYDAVLRFEQADRLATLRPEADTYGAYYGHRIGIVNDPMGGEVEGMMEAALVGMTIQNTEVRIGDLLVISEDADNRLYRMETTDPVQFNDTGLIVEFDRVAHRDNTYAEAVAVAAANAVTAWGAAATAVDAVEAIRVENGRGIQIEDVAGVTVNGDAITHDAGAILNARFENGRLYFNDGETYVNVGDLAFTTDGIENIAADTVTVRTGADTATLTGTLTGVNYDALTTAIEPRAWGAHTGGWVDTTTTIRNDWADAAIRAVEVAPITHEEIERIAERFNEVPNIHPDFLRVDLNRFNYDAPPRGKRREVVKDIEKDLDPGDTKLLDEFLGGFLRSGA